MDGFGTLGLGMVTSDPDAEWKLDGNLGGRCWKFGWKLEWKLGWSFLKRTKRKQSSQVSNQVFAHRESCLKKPLSPFSV